jgi:hypothetical protein
MLTPTLRRFRSCAGWLDEATEGQWGIVDIGELRLPREYHT